MIPILQQTEAAILKKAPPQLVPVIQKVVTAGKQVMYAPQSRQMLAQELQNTDPESLGSAVAKLIGMLQNHAKGTIPPKALIPAATILLCEGLQFLQDAGKIKVTPQLLASCMQAMGSAVLQVLGVSPEKLQALMQQGQQAAQPAAQPPQGIIAGAAQ